MHCVVPAELARARYRARAGTRHAGHLDADRGEAELWGTPSRPPGIGPVVEVNTSGPVNVGRLAATLAQLAATG